MNLLIFRTDVKTKNKVNVVKPIFNNHPIIKNWSIDTEDIDKVLRIEVAGTLAESDVIRYFTEYVGWLRVSDGNIETIKE